MIKSDRPDLNAAAKPLPIEGEPLPDEAEPAEKIPLSLILSHFCLELINRYTRWLRSLRQNGSLKMAGQILPDLPIAKDLMLILRPKTTWQRIADRPRGWMFVFIYYLLPMFLLLALVEGFGLVSLGRQQLAAGATTHPFTPSKVMAFEIIQGAVSLCLLVIVAICIRSFANTHHARNNTGQGLVLVFHAAGPLLLIQLLNGIPGMNLWVSWLIGMILALGALYQGIPKVLQPDVPSAMGLYLSSAVTIVLLMFVGRLLSYGYLAGHLKLMDSVVSAIAEKLPLD